MAISDTTVGDLLPRLSWIIDGSNTVDATYRPNYVWALNDRLRELVLDTDFWTFRMKGSLGLTAGQDSYNLNDDFRALIEPSMVHGDSPQNTLRYVSHQEWDEKELDRTTSDSKPRIFTILGRGEQAPTYGSDGANVLARFYPTPDAVYSVKYRYFAYPLDLTSDTDGTTVIDRRFPPYYYGALVSGAVLNFPERVTKQELQSHSRNFEIAKRQMRSDNRGAVGQTYQRGRWGARGGFMRRLWNGTGTSGAAWNGGSSGPIL